MSVNFTRNAYYIFMFLLPLIFSSEVSDTVLLPRQLLLSIFSAVLFLIAWKNNKNDYDRIKIGTANLAMILYFLIAAVVSICTAALFSESIYSLSKLWILISFSLLTTWLLQRNVITTHHIINAVIIFGCMALVTSTTDLVEKTIRGQHFFRSIQDISGNFANKNLLSSILFLCLPFFMIGCHGRKRTKLLSLLALFLALFLLLILRTRAALIATFIFFGIIGLILLHDRLKRKVWWGIILLVGASVIVFLKFRLGEVIGGLKSSSDIKQQYFFRLFNTNTIKNRILFWQNSIDMIREHPFGVGLGNWQIHFPKYGLGKFDTYEIANGIHTLQRPHNDFLWVLCETGIFGFTAFIAIFLIIGYQAISLIKGAANKYQRWLFIYIFSALIGFIIIAFFDFPLERVEHFAILMLLFSIVIYHYGIQNNGSFGVSIKKSHIALFIALGIFFSFVIAYKRFESERHVSILYNARKIGNIDEILLETQNAESTFYKIDSRTIPLKWYMGTAYFSQGKFSESEECFEAAYALTPYNIHAINNLASCYEINGKRKAAIKMYLKALQISPKFEEARLNLAAVYFNDKAYEMAFITIDSCDLNTRDPKYKVFLPVILKSKVDSVLETSDLQVSNEIRSVFSDQQHILKLYYESKRNNITFDQQIINVLKK